jgi:superfamily II DNA/RNA helicase
MAATRPRSTTTTLPRCRTTFAQLGLPPSLVAALAEAGITEPFPIQAATLPDTLAGRDVLGRGRTGSGKTYAFVLPVLARLASHPMPRRPGRPRALILAPTRELTTQIHAAMAPLAAALALRTMTVFGGVGANPQIRQLNAGVDVLVACPGRLRDHISGGHASLDDVEITVLDEADHMADLGFLPTVRWLMERTPPRCQRLLFSATLDTAVDVLVRRFLNDPVTHRVDPEAAPVATMTHHLLHVREDDRLPVLVDLAAAPGRTLVFTRTKHGAKRLTRQLNAAGVPSVELHGNLAQNARDRNLRAFTNGTARTLVATDIAARGIHVDDVALVVHADPPVEHKAYLHRSGRTARAGADGTVITLMTDDQVADVNHLARRAGIAATTTRLRPGDPLLHRLAPGQRTYVPVASDESTVEKATPARTGSARTGRARGRSGTAASPNAGADHASAGRPAHGQADRDRGTGGRTNKSRGTAVTATRSKAPSAAGTPPAKVGGAAAFSSSTRIGRRGR